MKRDVMVVGDLVAEAWIPGEQRIRRRSIGATACRDQPVYLQELRRCAVLAEPIRHCTVAVQLSDRVRRPSVGALAVEVGPVGDHGLGQRHIPRARHHMQRRLAVLGEHRVRVGAVLEQPHHSGSGATPIENSV